MCQICLIRSARGDIEVTFGRLLRFSHTKNKIPIKSPSGTPILRDFSPVFLKIVDTKSYSGSIAIVEAPMRINIMN